MRVFNRIVRRRPRPGRASRGLACGLLTVLALAGCDDVERVPGFEPVTDPAQLFMGLRLNHRAINLSTVAPYDTIQLAATPLDGRGEPITGLPAPTFRSGDTARVRVSPDGSVQAREAASGVPVIAELLVEGEHADIRHVDTAYVNVTTDSTPPRLATFSITPETDEAADWPLATQFGTIGVFRLERAGIPASAALPLRVLDEDGAAIAGLEIEYRSLDPATVRIDPRTGAVRAHTPGEATIVARTTAYGIAVADTATFTVSLPIVQGARLRAVDLEGTLDFGPTEVTIRPNGYVFFENFAFPATPMEVTFDDPTNVAESPEVCATWGGANCGAGDIPSLGEFQFAGRQFPVPGTYEYTVRLDGDDGQVYTGRVVVAEDATP